MKNTIAACITAAVGLCLSAGSVLAQLTPDRTYYGINRAAPFTVKMPEGGQGGMRIDLYEFGKDKPASTAAVVPGGVDMAALFPDLWKTQTPKVMAAQLVVGEEKVGPPVILQPLLDPPSAVLYNSQSQQVLGRDPTTGRYNFDPRAGQVMFVADNNMNSGVRAYVLKNVVFETSKGDIEFALRPDMAPNTVWNFQELVRGGFYTDIIFHRIIPRLGNGHPFVVQGGDPTGTGGGGPGYNIDLEPSTLPHDFGVLSMARSAEPNTNGSQVFICLSREGTNFLDNNYCSFAQAVKGTETITALGSVEVQGDRPKEPPVLKNAKLVDAPAYAGLQPAVKRPEAAKPAR